MSQISYVPNMPDAGIDSGQNMRSAGLFVRSMVIGLTAFLTVVDLFATQAILPSITRHYGVTPGAAGFAVNASTMGMAVAGLGIADFSQQIGQFTGEVRKVWSHRWRTM